MAYRREGDVITLTMDEDQYAMLLMALGMAGGVAARDGEPMDPWLELANQLNEGNPNWVPYSAGKSERAS